MKSGENLSLLICPSCSQEGNEMYCGHCGEKLKTDRITLPYILNQWIDIYVGIDSGLPATIKNMLIGSGDFINSYFHGKRIGFYNPMKFALLLGSFTILTTLFFTGETLLEIEPSTDLLFHEFYQFINKNLNLFINFIIILQFPIAALFTWRRNIKKGITYGEHLYVNALISGEIFIFQIVLNLTNWISKINSLGIIFDVIFPPITALYFAYVYSSWIHGEIKFPKFLKTEIGCWTIYIVSFLLAFLICIFILYLYTILIYRTSIF